jgi:hypothetical protein
MILRQPEYPAAAWLLPFSPVDVKRPKLNYGVADA